MKWFRAFWQRYFARRAGDGPLQQPAKGLPQTSQTSPVAIAPAPIAPVPPPASLSLTAFARIATPAGFSPRDIVQKVAAGYFPKVNASGWIGIIDGTGRLDISCAKHLGLIALHGVAFGDAAYVDRFLLGTGGVLSYAVDGSFPTQDFGEKAGQHSIHKKTITMCEVAQGLYAVKASPFYVGSRMATVDSLITHLGLSARWLAGSADMANFFNGAEGKCNQLLSIISFLHTAGVLTNDVALQSAARVKLEWVFGSIVSEDGVFREQFGSDGIGFDITYQLFSVRLGICHAMLLPIGPWRAAVEAKIRLGITRWLQAIDVNTGLINDSDSTRTAVDPVLHPGSIATWDDAADAYTLYLAHYALGSSGFPVALDVLALRMIKAGQTTSHREGG